jgi:hypothetical protein
MTSTARQRPTGSLHARQSKGARHFAASARRDSRLRKRSARGGGGGIFLRGPAFGSHPVAYTAVKYVRKLRRRRRTGQSAGTDREPLPPGVSCREIDLENETNKYMWFMKPGIYR